MTELFTALALVLVVEGVLYALFPSQMQEMMRRVQAMPPASLRGAGLAAAGLGVGAVWLIRL